MSTPSNGSTLNTAGSADLSFGNTTPKKGTVIDVDTAGISRVLSDGSIITVGLFSNDTGRHIGITKYTPTGDVEFVFRETPADEREVLIDMLVQPDDNPLLLAARFDGTAAFITRFKAEDGNVDISFGTNGQVKLDEPIRIGLNSSAGLALQANNHMLCVLNDGTDGYIYQISPSGKLVNFGQDSPTRLPEFRLNKVLTTDNGFVVGGFGWQGKAQIMGLRADGSLDSGFGNHGVGELELAQASPHHVSALAKGPNGEISVIGGSSRLPRTTNFVARLLASGHADNDFNKGKPLEVADGNGNYASVVIQADGKIVVLAGDNIGRLVNLIRYTVDGELDLGFGTQGIAVAWDDPTSRPLHSYVNKLELVQPEEKLQSSGNLYSRQSFIGRLLSR